MSSILEGTQAPASPRRSADWEAKLARIQSNVQREAWALYFLGTFVYGGGTAAILYFVRDRALSLVLQMFLFQLILMFFGVMKMYTNMRVLSLTGIEQSRDTMPVFEDLALAAQRLHQAADKMGTDPVGRVERKMEEFVQRIEAKADKIAGTAEKLAPDEDANAALERVAARMRLPLAGASGNGDQHEGSAT